MSIYENLSDSDLEALMTDDRIDPYTLAKLKAETAERQAASADYDAWRMMQRRSAQTTGRLIRQRRRGAPEADTRPRAAPESATKPRGRQGHVPGQMNGIERKYAAVLEARKVAGEIRDYGFEGVAFRVGLRRCFYHPDFHVFHLDGHLELVECKGARKPGHAAGSSQDVHPEGRVKFEAAAQRYWWNEWTKVTWRGGAFVTLAHYPNREAAA
jgi:hypothetical protein